jgi:DNA-binding transcriptional ArsR family regulator
MRTLPHPTRDQIELPDVLDCLSDPTRLAIVYNLARLPAGAPEMNCGDFHVMGTKSNLTYHFAKLRGAGVVRTRIQGTARFMRLRRADLDIRFPGLLDAVIKSAAHDAERLQLVTCGIGNPD